MNIPMSWLNDYVDVDCDIKTFTDKMTMSGSAVETVSYFGNNIINVVVGKILSIEKHENADKLILTKVSIGKENTLQIVTGATNLTVGDYVPVALDGATIAKGVKIKKGKLRGVMSEGMLCSIDELGYTKHDYPEAPENGIYIFQEEHILGSDVKPILQLYETVIEFDITPNRADCFSVIGIAREAAATLDKKLKYPNIKFKESSLDKIENLIKIEIKNTKLCNRYIARVVKNIKIGASPLWLRHRLTSCGVKPINNIVDITNYVMLEFGQPLHAFDISKISNKKIIIRNAYDNETIKTLDGNVRKLDSSMTVISDDNTSLAIAGVIGGEYSKVENDTMDVLFESANFNSANIRKTSKKLGLRTDSSSKFEKGLDPNLALTAINRAMQLIELLKCGEIVQGHIDVYPNVVESHEIEFDVNRINSLLGINVSYEDVVQYLNKLEIEVDKNKAIIKSFRADLQNEADIAEEVLRLYGYNNIKPILITGSTLVGKKTKAQLFEDTIKDTMVSMGFYECLNYSFESPKVFNKLNIAYDSNLRNTVKIINPLGEDYSIMKTLTLNGILEALSVNYKRKNEEVSLFELAKVYIPKSLPLTTLPNEYLMLTMGLYGDKDFFALKGIIENLLYILNIQNVQYSATSDLSYMHPGRTADVICNNQYVGFLGEVHPNVSRNYEIDKKIYMAVLNVELLFKNVNLIRTYKEVAKFPSITRDLAIIVKDNVYSKDIENSINKNGSNLLEYVKLFDFYKGTQIEEGYKSLAYKVSFRAKDRTLTDSEIDKHINKIIKSLESNFNAILRN